MVITASCYNHFFMVKKALQFITVMLLSDKRKLGYNLV